MSDDRRSAELEEFRQAGHRMVDWIAEYLEHPERHPVLSRAEPGELAAALPTEAPEDGEPLDRILDDFERLIPPAVTHWNHPGFLAYFAISGSPPGILGELASAALNVNGMLWRTSPAATELEEVVLGWLRLALALPSDWFGVLTDTASVSSLVALAAARDAADQRTRARGLTGSSALRLYTSEQSHSSIDKAAIVLGVGLDNVIRIPTDDEFRLDPRALEERISTDEAAGHRPFAVVATVGTTSTTSVDPLTPIAEVAARHHLWLHVDAAYAGSAAIVPELRWIFDGVAGADSLVVNPHKWLFTPIDASALYTRRREDVRRAFSLVPEYLKTSEQDVTNFMDYGVQLGRRFRALKLWFVMRSYGLEGLRHRIRAHVGLAQGLAARVDAHPDLERLAPTPLSVVCLRARPRDLAVRATDPAVAAYLDRLNQAALEKVNAGGDVYLSHTVLRGRYTVRVAIGNLHTTAAHITRFEEQFLAATAELDEELREDL